MSKWNSPTSIKKRYERQLISVVREIARVINRMPLGNKVAIQNAMERFSEQLTPWAESKADEMFRLVANDDYLNWKSEQLQRDMVNNLKHNAISSQLIEFRKEHVLLISSLPLIMSEKVQELAFDAAVTGKRREEIMAHITGVTESRARLIARTEIQKAHSQIIQARAIYTGSEGYIWRTMKDINVRKSHKEMDGRFVYWDITPELSDGTHTHAGQIYNCRCFPEPVIPQRFQ